MKTKWSTGTNHQLNGHPRLTSNSYDLFHVTAPLQQKVAQNTHQTNLGNMPSLTAVHASPSGSKTSQKQGSEDSSAFENVLASSSQAHVVDKSSNSAQQSASSALGRSLASQMAFMFSRPSA